jgi:hypothetical protein
MGPISCPETSIRNYHYTLRNISEDRRSKKNSLILTRDRTHLLGHGLIKVTFRPGVSEENYENSWLIQFSSRIHHVALYTFTETLEEIVLILMAGGSKLLPNVYKFLPGYVAPNKRKI